MIPGGADIGDHSVVGAGSLVRAGIIPPFSLVIGDLIKPSYYKVEYQDIHGIRD